MLFRSGAFIRLFLPRGYKSVTSSAYEQPIALRSVQDVLDLGEEHLLTRVEVRPGGIMEGASLATLDLRRKYEAWVLRIDRKGLTISLPAGEEELQSQDVLLIYVPEPRKADLEKLFRSKPEATVKPLPLSSGQG